MAESEAGGTLSEVVEGFKNLLLERFSSPLLSSFAFSLVIYNYKFFVILLSETKIADKLQLLDKYSNDTSIMHIWGVPFILALLYTFIYAYIHRYILIFVLNRKKDELADRRRIEQDATYTYQDMQDLILRHGKEVTDLREQLQSRVVTENQLIAQLHEFKNVGNASRKLYPVKPSDLSPHQQQVLLNVGAFEDSGVKGLSIEDISGQSGLSYLITKDAVNDLVKESVLLQRNNSMDGEFEYLLSEQGIKLYIQLSNDYLGDLPN